jgi:hypothetical protein
LTLLWSTIRTTGNAVRRKHDLDERRILAVAGEEKARRRGEVRREKGIERLKSFDRRPSR